jgi:predicted kinase
MDNQIPDPALILLIGPAGSGKSTLARTWPRTEVLELDHYRALIADDPGDQGATPDAAFVLESVLDARLERKKNCVVDATNVEVPVRGSLLRIAKRHGMQTVALLLSTPLSVCLARNATRPDNRRVPENVVRVQHAAMVAAQPRLRDEGFDHVLFADALDRLEPFLQRLSHSREADLGRESSPGLGDLLLVRRFFGPEILPLWRWLPDSDLVTGRDRAAEIRLGQQRLTLAYRDDADGEGDIGFDVALPCPVDPQCTGPAWAPADSVTDLHQALTGWTDSDPDTICTVHGSRDDGDDVDQEDDDRAATALESVAGSVR